VPSEPAPEGEPTAGGGSVWDEIERAP